MSVIYESREAATAVSDKLKIYAQPQRLMIMSFLLNGEYTVTEIDEATKIGQPALSQQLAELRRGDLVDTRREGKQIYYRLSNDAVTSCIMNIEAMFLRGAPKPTAAPAASAQKPRRWPSAPQQAGAAGFATVLEP